MQEFQTCDGNARISYRPLRNLTLVGRYEYQWSTISTQPDHASGLSEVETANMTSQIFGFDVTWSPWSRLYLQGGFNYVDSQTETPASDYTRAVLDSQNNYWALNLTAGLVLDDKTDLNLGYFYYEADNFDDNSEFGLPLGAGASESCVTAGLVRRLSKKVRLSVKYGYSQYSDDTYGGHNDFNAHAVYSTIQYRF
jgi:hypothetical protein